MKYMFLALSLGFSMGCQNFKYYDPSKPHRGKTQFYNNYDNDPKPSVLKWYWERMTASKPDEPEFKPEVLKPDLKLLAENKTDRLYTWVGHSTALLQIQGVSILIDPVFSEKVSPFPFVAPKRLVKLPITISELPPIDIVVISHSHYDHLDLPSLRELEAKGQGKTLFYTPLGTGELLEGEKLHNVKEFDWWEEATFKDLKIAFVPAQHWTKRTPCDTNQSLWGGWFIQDQQWKFLYTGDTGYSKDFQDIHAKYGDMDVTMLPLGAYEPRWFMKQQHINPEEAVQIHRDLHSKVSIPVHWGTFRLSDEAMTQPILELQKLIEANKKEALEFRVPKHGETLRL